MYNKYYEGRSGEIRSREVYRCFIEEFKFK